MKAGSLLYKPRAQTESNGFDFHNTTEVPVIGMFRNLVTSARLISCLAICAVALSVAPRDAAAQMVLDKVALDFLPGQPPRDDVVVQNPTQEQLFVLVEPSRIMNPGQPNEERVQFRDPGELGLLVTPNRFIVQPGQRKVIRFAVIEPAIEQDRIYRVTVRPIVGQVESETTAIKVVFGYDLLVIVRPPNPEPKIEWNRDGLKLSVKNVGSTNALLSQGKQCNAAGEDCKDLPPKRLYPGAQWNHELERETPVEYYLSYAGKVVRQSF